MNCRNIVSIVNLSPKQHGSVLKVLKVNKLQNSNVRIPAIILDNSVDNFNVSLDNSITKSERRNKTSKC